ERKASKHARLVSILLLCVLAKFAPVATAQSHDKRSPQTSAGVIRGTITVTGELSQNKPLEGVRLELSDPAPGSPPAVTASDADGRYEFSNMPAGIYNLSVSQQVLKPVTRVVSLADHETKIEDVAL